MNSGCRGNLTNPSTKKGLRMFYTDVESLACPLPEDLRKVKAYGDYDRLNRMLDRRISDEGLPEALRTRLRLEKRIAARIPREYPYDRSAALALLSEELEGATGAELEDFIDSGKVDFIYVGGEMRFHRLFLQNLIKTRPELAPRVKNPERLRYKRQNFAALDAVIAEMKRDGGAARRWHMRHELRLRPEALRPGHALLVHLPLPVEYDCVSGFELIDAGPVAGYVSEADQRTIAFRKPCAPGDVFFAEYRFDVRMKYHDLDPARATGGVPGEDALREQPPHIAFTPLVRAVAGEIGAGETNPLRLARRVYDFLTTRPIYSYVRSYFTYPNLVEHMLTAMKGDCGIFALTFITLCRCLGVPARWQSGLYCAPHDVGCHDWAQFYCEPWGWLPVDCSYGNAAFHNGDMARWDFYFGHMDPFRLPAARAFQTPFDPPKRHLRSDPYDNQNGEAEYEDEGLMSWDFDEVCRMVRWEKLEGEG